MTNIKKISLSITAALLLSSNAYAEWTKVAVCEDKEISTISLDFTEIQNQNGEAAYKGANEAKSTLTKLLAGNAYHINTTVSDLSTITGTTPTNKAIPVTLDKSGYNLVAACEDISADKFAEYGIKSVKGLSGDEGMTKGQAYFVQPITKDSTYYPNKQTAQDAVDKSITDDIAAAIKDRTLPTDTQGTTIVFDPAVAKTAIIDEQKYTVNVTVSKGTQSTKTTFEETVDPDAALVAAANKEATDALVAQIKDRTLPNDLKGTTVEFDPAQAKTATAEVQTYTVTATVTKGKQESTTTFEETIAADPVLLAAANKAAVDAVVAEITNRTLPNDLKGTTVVFDPATAKIATTEDQTYKVTVTVTKGEAKETIEFNETVAADAKMVEAAANKAAVDAVAARLDDNNDTAIIDLLRAGETTIDGVTVTYNTTPPAATAEDQTYDADITLSKGDYSVESRFDGIVKYDIKQLFEADSINNSLMAALTDGNTTYGDYTIEYDTSNADGKEVGDSYEMIVTFKDSSGKELFTDYHDGVVKVSYDTTVTPVEGSSVTSNGNGIMAVVDGISSFSFTKGTLPSPLPQASTQYISVDGNVVASISFIADVYENKSYEIVYNGTTYSGTFVESGYFTPTVLTAN